MEQFGSREHRCGVMASGSQQHKNPNSPSRLARHPSVQARHVRARSRALSKESTRKRGIAAHKQTTPSGQTCISNVLNAAYQNQAAVRAPQLAYSPRVQRLPPHVPERKKAHRSPGIGGQVGSWLDASSTSDTNRRPVTHPATPA